MADVFSRKKRSDVMSRIRSEGNTDTELALIRVLKKNGITGWRRRWPLLGKPDFVFPAAHLAVFVDGCFWHACKQHSKPPKTNCEYWRKKLRRNRERDLLVAAGLRARGWRVLRLWEHELAPKNERMCVRRLLRALQHQ
jgi:DNA mismatch endonuclease (patch repair protein)